MYSRSDGLESSFCLSNIGRTVANIRFCPVKQRPKRIFFGIIRVSLNCCTVISTIR